MRAVFRRGTTSRMGVIYVAKRRFDPSTGERWDGYVAWSGLTQLREIISLDEILCPTVPDRLIAADWDHNVQADYQTSYFRSLDYLQSRVSGETGLNILAVLQNPSAHELGSTKLPGFAFAGFEVLDIHGDVSALTNCGGFDGVFQKSELSDLGLVRTLGRADEIQRRLRMTYPSESHAECHVWAVWRLEEHARTTEDAEALSTEGRCE